MNDKQKQRCYVDKIAPAIPDWYADIKYSTDMTTRENYLTNALNPYASSYSFYNLRESMKKQQLETAAKLERERQIKIKDKQNKRKNWRNKVKYIL